MTDNPTKGKPLYKAALMSVLYELDQAGMLAGLSQSEIARRLGLVNRCRVSRALKGVRELREMVPWLRAILEHPAPKCEESEPLESSVSDSGNHER